MTDKTFELAEKAKALMAMTDIPEWALAAARETFLLLERTPAELKARVRQGAYDADPHLVTIARALVATAAKVERERREADAAFIDDHDIGNSSSGPFVKPRLQGNQDGLAFAVAIRALPLKYGDPQ